VATGGGKLQRNAGNDHPNGKPPLAYAEIRPITVFIVERVGDLVVDDFKHPAPLVSDGVLNVLQHEGRRAVAINDFSNGEEPLRYSAPLVR
jgi:hypothetical protein